jgi:hypothetical protein
MNGILFLEILSFKVSDLAFSPWTETGKVKFRVFPISLNQLYQIQLRTVHWPQLLFRDGRNQSIDIIFAALCVGKIETSRLEQGWKVGNVSILTTFHNNPEPWIRDEETKLHQNMSYLPCIGPNS